MWFCHKKRKLSYDLLPNHVELAHKRSATISNNLLNIDTPSPRQQSDFLVDNSFLVTIASEDAEEIGKEEIEVEIEEEDEFEGLVLNYNILE
jgi:hypothetical protein